MGCDIHIYAERGFESENRETGEKSVYWMPVSYGQFGSDRDYLMFSILAGVRGDESNCLYPPRGVPHNMSYGATDDYILTIDDEKDSLGIEGYTSTAKAADWVRLKMSEYFKGDTERVTQPDYHNASWLNYEEYGQAIQEYLSLSNGHFPASYVALYAHLSVLESCGEKTRVIFWFDN